MIHGYKVTNIIVRNDGKLIIRVTLLDENGNKIGKMSVETEKMSADKLEKKLTEMVRKKIIELEKARKTNLIKLIGKRVKIGERHEPAH